ncbi:MAG TPA: hypothetical protein VN577_12875 [Terriglobales bacterium]|nr:hypothetical protein [Terriglobales bacterium]
MQQTRWRGRDAWLLSNGLLDIVTLPGGGHVADVRFQPEAGYPTCNVLWEAPWRSIDPERFRSRDAAVYGVPFVGKFLSGFTGHALCLDYFGAPSPDEIQQGLTLHGEAPVARWTMKPEQRKRLNAAVELPHAGLNFVRTIESLPGESVVYFRETVKNQRTVDRFCGWVEHATFGPPLMSPGESDFFVSGSRAKTWALGYEGKAILRDNAEFHWPHAPALKGRSVDLRKPFANDGKGFVATVLVNSKNDYGVIAVLNWRLGLAAGYVFRSADFPWVTLWEENIARSGAPWNGVTRARGVEFGTTPFPVGHQQTISDGPLFQTPTLTRVPAKSALSTVYAMFLTPVSREWRKISDIQVKRNEIVIRGGSRNQRLAVVGSKLQSILA